MEYFVDTCIIICYASNFGIEKYGKSCEEFFKRDFDRITSKNVKKELEHVKKRRMKLYSAIAVKDLSEVKADKNVEKHFQEIVKAVEDGRIELENLRKIEMFFKNRCRNAIKKIKEIIDIEGEYEKIYGRRYEKINWDCLLGERIGNTDDGKVVMDCAILSSLRGKLVLVTIDNKHILSKKDVIFTFINDYCSITDLQPEFEIRHVTECLNS